MGLATPRGEHGAAQVCGGLLRAEGGGASEDEEGDRSHAHLIVPRLPRRRRGRYVPSSQIPYSAPHQCRVVHDQREVSWLVATRRFTSSILRWKNRPSTRSWSGSTPSSPRTARAPSRPTATGASAPWPTTSRKRKPATTSSPSSRRRESCCPSTSAP